MKKLKKLSLFGFAALMLSMASCSDETVISEPNQPLEADQSFYVPINVNSFGADRTRAYDPTDEPEFDEGTSDENAVESVYLVFYDASGKRLSATDALNDLNQASSTKPSENSLYTGVVQVDVKRGEKVPAYVLAFVNPVNTADFSNSPDFETLQAVEKSTRASLIDADGKFAMSNSVYYGTDEVTKDTDFRIMATPIATGKLFNNREDAEKALENADDEDSSVVDIYVERYAGKVNFSIEETAVQPLVIDGKKLVFIPEAWAVNADEDVSFITKTFFGQVGESSEFNWNEPASFEAMNTLFNKWTWNSEENHRSYWGQSPSYYIARYPRVADDILDEIENDPTLGKKGTYDLKYYSYKEIIDNAKQDDNKAKARDLKKNAPLYPRENTVAGKSLWSAYDNPYASPRAAIASVVLVGHYEVDDKEIPEDTRFYVTGNSTNGYKYYDEDGMRKFFLDNTIKLASDEDGTAMDYDVIKNYITIDHPSQNVRGGLVIDSRYVTLQLTKDAINHVYAKSGDKFVLVTEENIDAVNQNVMSAAGTAFGYKGGKAYFNIPIQHLGYYREDNKNLSIANGANSYEFKWKEAKSGDFGIVRNHVYTIKANLIKGLGNAIPREDDPIVPPTDPDEYFIGARIIVLNWAIVPTQSVDL